MPETEVLSDPAAKRLLARASELDAAGAAVADLRAAAAEAGISSHAFDAALAELHGDEQARVPAGSEQPRRRPWMWALGVGVAILVALGALVVARSPASVDAAAAPAAPMVEEALLLRCLSADQAAELIRPHLTLLTNTVVFSSARAPRVLTIRATPAQMQKVRSVLDQYERPGSASCPAGPTPPVNP